MGAYEVFEQLLRERGVTAYQVSKATGIRPSSLTDWKKGRYELKLDKLQKIADYFGVTVDYLMCKESHTSGEPAETSAHTDAVYYTNPETAKVAQAVFENSDLRLLFDAAEDCAPDQIRLAAEMLRKFKEGK